MNKEAAEQAKTMGATALKQGDFTRAHKLLSKSLRLYPLPGVKALLSQVERMQSQKQQQTFHSNASNHNNNERRSNSNASNAPASSTANTNTTSNTNTSNHATNADQQTTRGYTPQQEQIVKDIMKITRSTNERKKHYKVLGISDSANESEIKKAYRKLALKLHPDKNSAPEADEAFKAVGLAYATLSDERKRQIYDQYGDEDPDSNSGAGAAGFRRRSGFRGGEEVSPEDIFNMFFGGMHPGGAAGGFGGPGFRVHTTGFGPGFSFHTGGMPRRNAGQQQGQGQQPRRPPTLAERISQFLPIIFFILMSFMNMPGDQGTSSGTSTPYFSLTRDYPFTNERFTSLTRVKDIPYYVNDKFVRLYARDRYQLSQVERLVERNYEKYLQSECKAQMKYRDKLINRGKFDYSSNLSAKEKEEALKEAEEFKLSRCIELDELFPSGSKKKRRQKKY